MSLFTLFFYIFSFFLSFFDIKKRLVPNDLIYPLFIILLLFGFIENKINVYSIIILLLILLIFIILISIMPTIILGGGDIKYMMLVALFIPPLLFPLFLLITGIIQTFLLLYFQKIKKRRTAPMVPSMFLTVIFIQLFCH